MIEFLTEQRSYSSSDISSMMVSVSEHFRTRDLMGDCTLHYYLTEVCSSPYVSSVCERLREFRKHEGDYDYWKGKQRCSTISCRCSQTRCKDNVVERHPIICLDFDGDDNPRLVEGSFRSAFINALFRLPYVYACGTSCHGDGVFAVVVISSNINDDDFLGYFKALEAEFARYSIIIDKACKDVTRLRIASSDAPLIKSEETILHAWNKRLEEEKTPQPAHFHHAPVVSFLSEENIVTELINELLDRGFAEGNYNKWISWGFSLSCLPAGHDLFHRLSEQSPGYGGYEATEAKWRNLSRSSTGSFQDLKAKVCGAARLYLGEGYWTRAKTEINKRNYNLKNKLGK